MGIRSLKKWRRVNAHQTDEFNIIVVQNNTKIYIMVHIFHPKSKGNSFETARPSFRSMSVLLKVMRICFNFMVRI